MAPAGVSEAEMAAVDGDDAAMHALAEQMMARTVGDAGAGVETSMSEVESLVQGVESLQKTQAEVLREDGPSSSSSSSSSSGHPSVGVEEMAAKLAEQKRRMDAVAKEVETQRAAAAAAGAGGGGGGGAEGAEAKKEEQGRRVDATSARSGGGGAAVCAPRGTPRPGGSGRDDEGARQHGDARGRPHGSPRLLLERFGSPPTAAAAAAG